MQRSRPPLKQRLEEFTETLMDQCERVRISDPDNYLNQKGSLQSLEVAVRILKAWDSLDIDSVDTAEELLGKRLNAKK
jgi:hypothetical protein